MTREGTRSTARSSDLRPLVRHVELGLDVDQPVKAWIPRPESLTQLVARIRDCCNGDGLVVLWIVTAARSMMVERVTLMSVVTRTIKRVNPRHSIVVSCRPQPPIHKGLRI